MAVARGQQRLSSAVCHPVQTPVLAGTRRSASCRGPELTDGFHLLGQSMTLASSASGSWLHHRSKSRGRAHVFPGASHTAHVEVPEEFNRIVGEFLDESERAR